MITPDKLLIGLMDRWGVLLEESTDFYEKRRVLRRENLDTTELEKEHQIVEKRIKAIEKALLKTLEKAIVSQEIKDKLVEALTIPLIPLDDSEPEQGVLIPVIDIVEEARAIFG